MFTSLGTALVAGALAVGGSLAAEDDGKSVDARQAGGSARTALVIDASHARDGRELVDPRLHEVDAEVRLPRTSTEARTNVRYFDALGYRVVVEGPAASAAADATGVAAERAPDLEHAIGAAER
jgi:hypothetical protein